MRSLEQRAKGSISLQRLKALKEQERARLQALPPEEAQAIADGILHPRLWQLARGQVAWPGEWWECD